MGMRAKTDHSKGKHGNAFKPKKFTTLSRRNNLRFDRQAPQFRVEKKYTDTQNNGILCPAGAAWRTPILLNGCSQGAAPNNHVGRAILMKSVQIRYTVTQSSGNGPSQVRTVIVYDKQPNGAFPATIGTVFQIDRFDSPLTMSNADRFIVVMDEVSESRQSTQVNISGQRYVKMSLPTVFGGTGNTIADINSGALLMYISCNEDSAGTDVTPVDSFIRVRFTDI